MIVVGGTYREICVWPEWDLLAGSGLRAAASLANAPEPPVLHTAVSAEEAEEFPLVAAALSVAAAEPAIRSEPVGFTYFTPLTNPWVNGPGARLNGEIRAAADVALVFGMVERGRVAVEAATIVVDPQRPRDTAPGGRLDGLAADRLVLVANAAEVRNQGNDADPEAAARAVLESGFDAVVTKRAAAGCQVTWRDAGTVRTEVCGAHPTASVFPIGSGDVFSAGFAHALSRGAELVEAARVGSAAAAHYCSTLAPALPAALLAGDFSSLPDPLEPARPAVYLAGPFFAVGERWLVDQTRDALSTLGADPWSPVHEVGPGGLDVARKDIDGLEGCRAVLALLDGSDPGTVFEVGWALRHGIPVVGYATAVDPEATKMLAGLGAELHRDLSTACYRAVWAGMGNPVTPGWRS